jgi:molecular chaperone GrpE
VSAEPDENRDEPAAAPVDSVETADVDDYRDKYLRLQADMDNYRKRLDRNLAETARRRKADLLVTFLPILDNLIRALEAAQSAPESDGLLEGVKLTGKQFGGVLERHGISRIPAAEEFDPRLHEVVATTPRSDVPEGSILEVLATGYLLDGEVLRATAVRVAAADDRGEPAVADDVDPSADAGGNPLDVQA